MYMDVLIRRRFAQICHHHSDTFQWSCFRDTILGTFDSFPTPPSSACTDMELGEWRSFAFGRLLNCKWLLPASWKPQLIRTKTIWKYKQSKPVIVFHKKEKSTWTNCGRTFHMTRLWFRTFTLRPKSKKMRISLLLPTTRGRLRITLIVSHCSMSLPVSFELLLHAT